MLQRLTAVLAVALFATGIAGVVSLPDTDDEPADPPSVAPVNAVIGDMSYIKRFGHPPGPETDETLRIQTHLAYVEQLLRARPTDHLSPEQQAARARHLDRLRQYWMQVRFPHNDDPSSDERQPTFIDSDGRICAVGYLIAESAGWDVAERINAEYKYAYIEDIDAPVLDEWAEDAGFTRRELAMIQPAYDDDGCVGCIDDEEKMARGVEIGGMAVNAGAALLNGMLSARGQRSYAASGAGLALGTAGLAMGLSDRAHYSTGDAIFAGASIFMSAWNLAAPLQRRATASSDAKSSASTTATLIPDTHVAALPDQDATPKMGLSLRWSF